MLLLYCCMVVSGLFTLVFGGDIVFFIYLTCFAISVVVKHIHACMMHAEYTSVRMLLYTEKCFTHRTTQLKITRVNSFSHNSAVSYTT